MSNTTRPFSTVRRRPNLLDLIIPKDPAVQKYRLYASPTFDGTFTQIIEADISAGFLDPNINKLVLQSINNRNHVRCAFDPQTFNGVASIDDAEKFWLTFQPVDFAGAPGTQTPPTLILTENDLRGDARIQFTGTAPSGADVSDSLILYLPRLNDIVIQNLAPGMGGELFYAMEPGGGELRLEPGEHHRLMQGGQGCLLVRGNGATVDVGVSATSYLPL